MAVRPTEISDIIRQQIAGFDDTTSLTNVGTVVSIGDGIANVYGLSNVMASELVEFPRTSTTGSREFCLFFLACVILAGLYGGVTVSRRILLVQALPAALALVAVLLAR